MEPSVLVRKGLPVGKKGKAEAETCAHAPLAGSSGPSLPNLSSINRLLDRVDLRASKDQDWLLSWAERLIWQELVASKPL